LIQFIHVDPNNFGPVEINGENQTVSSTPQTVRHNFSLYPTITLIANPVYPLQFDSWHIAEPMTSANKISNSSKLTISSGSFNSATSFYVNAS